MQVGLLLVLAIAKVSAAFINVCLPELWEVFGSCTKKMREFADRVCKGTDARKASAQSASSAGRNLYSLYL